MSCPVAVRVLVPSGPAVVRVVTQGPPGTSTGGGAGLSDAAPLPLAAMADPGESEEASRADHEHALPSAQQVGADPTGTAAAAIASHVAAADAHSQYTTPQEAAAAAPVQSVALSLPSGWSTQATSAGGNVTLSLGLPTGQTLLAAADKTAWDAAATRVAQLGEDDSPTFAGLTVAGTATLSHIHGNLAGQVYEHVRNVSGASLSALTPYRVTGSQGDTDRVTIVAARADDPALMPASGILAEALANNGDGHGVVGGVITGVSTAGLTSGAPLYVAPTGGTTATMPTTGLVQVVAVVGRVHANTGTVIVLPGSALSVAAFTGATGDLTESGNNIFFTAARAIASALTGFSAAAGTVAATDSILQAFQKVVGNIAERALSGLISSSNLTMNPNRLAGRITTGIGAVEEVAPAGGMVLIGGSLVPGEIVKLIVSNIGETGITTGNFKNETRIDRPFTLLGLWWNCHPTAMGSASTSDARPYIRTGAGTTSAGTKTNILTTANNIASLAASVHTVDATSNINGGAISGSAGDWLGVDLMSVGTGSSGHFLTFILRYS